MNASVSGYFNGFNKRQLMELTIFRAQVGEERFDAHRSTSRTLDKFVWLKLAPMLIEMFAQPGVQRSELTNFYLIRNIGMRFNSGSVELRTRKVANSVALKSTTHAAGISMDVLQATISIVGRNDSEIGLHTCAPGFR